METEQPAGGKVSDDLPQPTFSIEPLRPHPSTQRLSNLWKTILFLVLAGEIGPAVMYSAGTGLLGMQTGELPPEFLLFVEAGSFGTVVGLTVLLSRLERRPFGEYGLPLKEAFAGNFWVGLLLGLAEGSVLVGLILVLGGYSFGLPALHGLAVLRWGGLHLLLFVFVGFFEEFVYRGYAQVALTRVMGFWPAAIVLSVGFGLLHLGNRGENWIGVASVALVGGLFAFTLKRSGNLWYAVGLHAGFDWAETFLYSVPNSGEILKGHLSNAVLQGPNWLTGGSVGPEGSVFCFLTIGLQFLVAAWLFPAKKEKGKASEAEEQPVP